MVVGCLLTIPNFLLSVPFQKCSSSLAQEQRCRHSPGGPRPLGEPIPWGVSSWCLPPPVHSTTAPHLSLRVSPVGLEDRGLAFADCLLNKMPGQGNRISHLQPGGKKLLFCLHLSPVPVFSVGVRLQCVERQSKEEGDGERSDSGR